MSSETIITVEGLGKRFDVFSTPSARLRSLLLNPVFAAVGRAPIDARHVWALRDVSFHVERGQALGIMGRNGSGKSTLLQMLCGTLSPSAGTVAVHGRIAALLELGAGFNPEFTGRENVYLNGMLLGLDRATLDERFDAIAGFADIGHYIDEPTKTYSSGMFVRLAFAVATSVDADVLIVDEALAVGDARFQARCMKRIRNIQDDGASVLFVSHDVGAVRTLCQRALWLENGRMRGLGPVLEISSSYMESIFADDPDSMPVDLAVDDAANADVAMALDDGETLCIDAAPVASWGTQPGLLLGASIGSEHAHNDVLQWGQQCTVRLRFKVPLDVDPATFGVAFSIKDLRGTDIVVSSTFDRLGARCPLEWVPGSVVECWFEFTNGLVEGKYLLVIALERRTGPSIEYYEYIEGARYFSSMAEQKYLGVYQPVVTHRYMERTHVR
jgi:lipopolysaccharide transport system ATP-binding protein